MIDTAASNNEPRGPEWRLITEVSEGGYFCDSFFSRSFGEPVPPYGHHIVTFYKRGDNHYIPLSYVNFLPWNSVILVGGAVTNKAAFSEVDEQHARELRELGGAYYLALKWAFRNYADECEAYFGYAADERALEVDINAGFTATEHDHLIVYFHRKISARRKKRLIAQLHELGPF
jgi:hypothetical protein